MPTMIYRTFLLFSLPWLVISQDRLSSSLELGYGNATNVAQTPTNEINGTFITPKAVIKGETSLEKIGVQDADFTGEISLQQKNFSDPLLDQNLREEQISASLGTNWFINENSFLGTNHSFTQFKGREIDFVNNSTNGLPSIFDGFFNEGVIGYSRGNFYLEGSLGIAEKKAKSLSNDENGNQFKDNYNDLLFSLRGIYSNNSQTWNFSYKLDFIQREYQERRSRFTEGSLDNNNVNPLESLDIFNNSLNIEWQREYDLIQLDLLANRTDDKIFGARDNTELGFSLTYQFTLLDKVNFNLNSRYSQKNYDNFIGEVITNSRATEKRKDINRGYSVELETAIAGFTPFLRYNLTNNSSNYPIQGFEDRITQAGFRYNL